jgi:hypothetical protein
LTEHGVDEPRKLERLVPLGDAGAFADEDAALLQLEAVGKDVVDALFALAPDGADAGGSH